MSRRGRRRGLLRYAVTAVLGLSGSRVPSSPADRRPWGTRSTSSFEAPLAADPMQLGRPAQLPPFGHGNGLDALFWTPLARLAADRVEEVLAALAAADIAGWVAPAGRSAAATADRPHDLWVGSLRLDAAQDVLMRTLSAPA